MKMAAHLTTNKIKFGYPKSRQQHDATIDKLKSQNDAPLKPSFKVLLLRGIIVIVYLLLGAVVFRALEQVGLENMQNDKLMLARQQLYRVHNVSHQFLQEYEQLVRNRKKEPKVWDYYQSLYFASTVTTTIGYGHITPQTQSGRMFLIIFALFGIPLNILALASVGEHITIAIFHFLRYISTRRNKKKRIKHINIKVMMVSIILMLCMLFIGGFLYCSTEKWSYIDSIYYCFVAMSTIGFGDLVPNKGRAPDSKEEKALWFLRALYLSIGLSLVSTVFTALSNAMEEINFLLARHKHGKDHRDSKDRRKSNRLKGDSEKISYKHKVKKQGSIVFKYKLLHKLKRKKEEGFIRTDWDRLLAEAKRKQHGTFASDKNMRDGKRASLLLLTNQKGFVPERYRLKTYQETNVVTVPIPHTSGETNNHQIEYLTPLKRPYMCKMNEGNSYRTRVHSSPIPVLSREEFHATHIVVSKTRSQPVAYRRGVQRTCHPIDYHIRNTVEYIEPNHNQSIEGIRNNHIVYRPAEQGASSLNNSYLVQGPYEQEYEIMVNQC